MVAVVGVSGSGKTSLPIGTLYAEGVQRFLESLSTYSRRRLSQAQRPDVDRIDHLPPALALRQRPPIPGPRSTVGTMSEVRESRIASRLRSTQDGSLYVIDEPTIGLHSLDLATLVGVFDRPLDAGPRSSSLTTTWTCSLRPITLSTWARMEAPTADASWLPARPKTSCGRRAA